MDTRPDAERIKSLKRHRAALEAGITRPKVPPMVAASEIRELDREIRTLEAGQA